MTKLLRMQKEIPSGHLDVQCVADGIQRHHWRAVIGKPRALARSGQTRARLWIADSAAAIENAEVLELTVSADD